MTSQTNDLPNALPDELFEVLAESQHVRIERIVSQLEEPFGCD